MEYFLGYKKTGQFCLEVIGQELLLLTLFDSINLRPIYLVRMGPIFVSSTESFFSKNIRISLKPGHFLPKNYLILYTLKWYSTTEIMLGYNRDDNNNSNKSRSFQTHSARLLPWPMPSLWPEIAFVVRATNSWSSLPYTAFLQARWNIKSNEDQAITFVSNTVKIYNWFL